MELFDFDGSAQATDHSDYLGTVLQVDTRRVIVNAEDDNLKLASVGNAARLGRDQHGRRRYR